MQNRTDNTQALIDRLLSGDARAMSRLITMVENKSPEKPAIMASLFPRTGRALVAGLTGSPGVGKSSLTDRLIAFARDKGLSVGVVAVDPSSPFSGGAILGDRIRMQSRSTDPGVFIRSMASRGHLGGLSVATRDATRIMDAFGKDVILIETIGVGQSELAIAQEAKTTVLVLAPGAGDSVQMMKAGIMEIGDVFVVNKADREGADQTVLEVETMLMLGSHKNGWTPPVIKTQATSAEGIEELWNQIQAHSNFLDQGEVGRERRRGQLRDEIIEVLTESIKSNIWQKTAGKVFENLLDNVEQREMDPYAAAGKLMEEIG
ncbi:MAG: methylmalonyl Co-A mutase-associated GTPase MeaB [Dehalococcoidia bacterium]|nr:methylmalonyl Co-A mutase-associated GTPase MeaB [Dehalococcoidia bacterium]